MEVAVGKAFEDFGRWLEPGTVTVSDARKREAWNLIHQVPPLNKSIQPASATSPSPSEMTTMLINGLRESSTVGEQYNHDRGNNTIATHRTYKFCATAAIPRDHFQAARGRLMFPKLSLLLLLKTPQSVGSGGERGSCPTFVLQTFNAPLHTSH